MNPYTWIFVIAFYVLIPAIAVGLYIFAQLKWFRRLNHQRQQMSIEDSSAPAKAIGLVNVEWPGQEAYARKHISEIVTLGVPPTSLDFDRLVPIQQALVTLPERLQSSGATVRTWATELATVGDDLGLLMRLRENPELLENSSLQLSAYFNGRLFEQFDRIRDSLLHHDDESVTRSIKVLSHQMSAWQQMTANWSMLREIALNSIQSSVRSDDFLEHRHAIVPLHVAQERDSLSWNAWAAIHTYPEVLNPLADWLIDTLQSRGWSFSVICALSTTGVPLATVLSTRLPRTLLAMDGQSYHFVPRAPHKGESVLLVDATVQTGKHLEVATQKVSSSGAVVVGAVIIAVNDLLPDGANRSDVQRWLSEGKLIYFYELSVLYKRWRGKNA